MASFRLSEGSARLLHLHWLWANLCINQKVRIGHGLVRTKYGNNLSHWLLISLAFYTIFHAITYFCSVMAWSPQPWVKGRQRCNLELVWCFCAGLHIVEWGLILLNFLGEILPVPFLFKSTLKIKPLNQCLVFLFRHLLQGREAVVHPSTYQRAVNREMKEKRKLTAIDVMCFAPSPTVTRSDKSHWSGHMSSRWLSWTHSSLPVEPSSRVAAQALSCVLSPQLWLPSKHRRMFRTLFAFG